VEHGTCPVAAVCTVVEISNLKCIVPVYAVENKLLVAVVMNLTCQRHVNPNVMSHDHSIPISAPLEQTEYFEKDHKYWGHDLDLLGSRDVISHATI